MEEKADSHLKCPEDTASICSNSVRIISCFLCCYYDLLQSLDERDLSTWRTRIDHVEELRENINSNSKYCAFIIEVQRLDSNNGNYCSLGQI